MRRLIDLLIDHLIDHFEGHQDKQTEYSNLEFTASLRTVTTQFAHAYNTWQM